MIEVEVEEPAWTDDAPDGEVLAQAAAQAALARFGRDADVVILLTDDAAVRELNARFLGKEQPTNVLSFPAAGSAGRHLGDIALAYGVCTSEAREQGKTLAQHLQHLVAHGVLHLLGYDHDSDADTEVMEDLERDILAGLGVPDPYKWTDRPG